MGVEFTAMIDHGLELEELFALPRILDAEWRREGSPLRRVLPHPPNPGSAWSWRLWRSSTPEQELNDEGSVSFDSPIGLWGRAYRQALELVGFARWWSFVCEPEVRDSLQAASRRIARLVRGTTIIYLPDNLYRCSEAYERLYEGRSVPEIVTWLGTECGPPAARAADIYVESDDGDWSTDGYVLETVAPTRSGTS